MNSEAHGFLTASELASRLKVEVSTIQTWARTGRIPVRRLTRKVHRFCLAEVLATLETGNGEGGGK